MIPTYFCFLVYLFLRYHYPFNNKTNFFVSSPDNIRIWLNIMFVNPLFLDSNLYRFFDYCFYNSYISFVSAVSCFEFDISFIKPSFAKLISSSSSLPLSGNALMPKYHLPGSLSLIFFITNSAPILPLCLIFQHTFTRFLRNFFHHFLLHKAYYLLSKELYQLYHYPYIQ